MVRACIGCSGNAWRFSPRESRRHTMQGPGPVRKVHKTSQKEILISL